MATCLWEADSVDDIQGYVDSTLGDSSENLCYEVDAEQSFAERPSEIQEPGRDPRVGGSTPAQKTSPRGRSCSKFVASGSVQHP